MTAEPVLRVRDLGVNFVTSQGEVQAVSGVSFDVRAGECLAVVVEILHLAIPDVGWLDLLAALEIPGHDDAGLQILELRLHIRLTLALAAKLR